MQKPRPADARHETESPSSSTPGAEAPETTADQDREDGAPKRRLMSLASQRRAGAPSRPRQDDDDPMARALELLSGIDQHVRDAERRPAPQAEEAPPDEGEGEAQQVEPGQAGGEVAEEGVDLGQDSAAQPAMPEAESDRREAPVDARDDDDDPRTWAEAFAGITGDDELPQYEPQYEEVVRTEDASPVVAKEAKRPPAKALYSLQEVHERTGIPYATLSLYAASHADRIPSLGERRSPAYPREGLEELCRIHAEKNPGWTPPEAGTEEGWDDESGLARRLDALADGLDSLRADLREVEEIVRRGWTAEVGLFD